MNLTTLAWGMPGTTEMIIIAVVALLIFGRRLPDVARSVGKSIVEFKKGIKDVGDDINVQSKLDSSSKSRLEQTPQPTETPSSTEAQAASNKAVESESPTEP